MQDVMQVAQYKRTRLMNQIDQLMAEIEELDDFIGFGQSLVPSTDGNQPVSHAGE